MGPGKEKRTKSDADSRMQVESTSMPTINESTESSETLDANTQRRIVGKSEPVAVTTQEAIDGYREKTRRIANVEQIELGNIMELSITGAADSRSKTSKPVWKSVFVQSEWMEHEESQPPEDCQKIERENSSHNASCDDQER